MAKIFCEGHSKKTEIGHNQQSREKLFSENAGVQWPGGRASYTQGT